MKIKTYLSLFFIALFFISCSKKDDKSLVVYTSVDQVFSSKIIEDFKKESGLDVKVVYDTEASKAVGLEKRLLAEKDSPKADVFWNSEFIRTARLDKQGVFDSYEKKATPQGLNFRT